MNNQVFLQRGGQSILFTEGWTIKFFYRGVDNQLFLQRGGQSSFFTEGWTIKFFLQRGGQ